MRITELCSQQGQQLPRLMAVSLQLHTRLSEGGNPPCFLLLESQTQEVWWGICGSWGKAQVGDLEIQACVLVLPGWEPLGNLPPSLEKNQKPCQIVNLELLTWETSS